MSTATPSTPRSKSATTRAFVDKPLIIGGGMRGVVSTCCYIARQYGVRSAMPMFTAQAALPGRGDHPARHGEICRGQPPDPRAAWTS